MTEQLIRDAGFDPIYLGDLGKAPLLESLVAMTQAVAKSRYRAVLLPLQPPRRVCWSMMGRRAAFARRPQTNELAGVLLSTLLATGRGLSAGRATRRSTLDQLEGG